MVEKRELVIACQGHEPQRQFGEVSRHRVLVDAVKAALCDEATGVQIIILVSRELGPRSRPPRPGPHEPRGEGAARLYKEGARAHRRITDLEFEHVFGPRVRAQPPEYRFERMPHDRLGQAARRVVAAGAAALGGRIAVPADRIRLSCEPRSSTMLSSAATMASIPAAALIALCCRSVREP